MKNFNKKNILTLIFILITGLLFAQQESFKIKVVDKKGEPIIGADVIRSDYKVRFGNTNDFGELLVVVEEGDTQFSVVISCLGYHERVLTFKELATNNIVKLKINEIAIDDVVIKALSIDDLMGDLYKKYKYVPKEDCFRFYSLAHIGKVVEANGKALCKKHEYGLMLTTPDYTSRKGKVIVPNKNINFMPIFSANSYDLTSDGKYRLNNIMSPVSSPMGDDSYHSQQFRLYLLLYLAYYSGPVFNDPKKFTFSYLDKKDSILTILFRRNIKSKNGESGSMYGTLDVDLETNRITAINFSYFDFAYHYFQYFPAKNNKNFFKNRYPTYKYELKIEFKYTDKNDMYVSYCEGITYWNRTWDKKSYFIFGSPRPFATNNNLVEKEYLKADMYAKIPEELMKKYNYFTQSQKGYSEGVYNEQFFNKNSKLNMTASDNFKALNDISPLKEQYKEQGSLIVNHNLDDSREDFEKKLDDWKYMKVIYFKIFDIYNRVGISDKEDIDFLNEYMKKYPKND